VSAKSALRTRAFCKLVAAARKERFGAKPSSAGVLILTSTVVRFFESVKRLSGFLFSMRQTPSSYLLPGEYDGLKSLFIVSKKLTGTKMPIPPFARILLDLGSFREYGDPVRGPKSQCLNRFGRLIASAGHETGTIANK
jgi:hypothetical protein